MDSWVDSLLMRWADARISRILSCMCLFSSISLTIIKNCWLMNSSGLISVCPLPRCNRASGGFRIVLKTFVFTVWEEKTNKKVFRGVLLSQRYHSPKYGIWMKTNTMHSSMQMTLIDRVVEIAPTLQSMEKSDPNTCSNNVCAVNIIRFTRDTICSGAFL